MRDDNAIMRGFYMPVCSDNFASQLHQQVLIVSDLHLSEGFSHETFRWHRRENFTADEAFAAFLKSKSEEADPKNTRAWLVINGDFIDFLRITSTPKNEEDLQRWRDMLMSITSTKLPEQKNRVLNAFDTFAILWRHYALNGSVAKWRWPKDIRDESTYGLKTEDYKSIYRLMLARDGHRRLFLALAEWLAAGHRLTIIPGNHDQEFNQELAQAGLLWMLEDLLRREYPVDEEGEALFAEDEYAHASTTADSASVGFQTRGSQRESNGRRVFSASHTREPWADDNGPSSTPDIARLLSFEPNGLEIDGKIRIEHGQRFEWMTRPGDDVVMSEHHELTLAPGSLFNRYLLNHVELEVPYLDNVKPTSRVLMYLLKKHPIRFIAILGQLIRTFFRLARKKGPGRLIFAVLQKIAQFGLVAAYVVWVVRTVILHLIADNLDFARTVFEFIRLPLTIVEWCLSNLQLYEGNLWQHIVRGQELFGVHLPLYVVLPFFALWFLISHYYYKRHPLHFSGVDLKKKMSEGFALNNEREPHFAICGHTHEADRQRWPRHITHINSGCWTPVFEYEGGHVRDDLTMTFVELHNDDSGWQGELLRWDPSSHRDTDLILPETREQNEAARQPSRDLLPAHGHKYTFEELAKLKTKQMDALMLTGGTPTMEEVLGYEYRGYNMNASTVILGTRKFKKGFFGDANKDHAWGYNVLVKQNKMSEPWLAKPNEQNPDRKYFFKLLPAGNGYDARYDHSLFVDYAKSGEYFILHPTRYTVDYLVYPDPENHDLMLGKSDAVIGPIRLPLGYFILERYNKSTYGRTSHFFKQREMRTLEKFAEVFIEGDDEVLTPEQVAWNVDKHVERIESNRTDSVRLVLFVMEHILPLLAGYLPFSRMSAKSRRRFIESTFLNSENSVEAAGIRAGWMRVFGTLRERTLRDLSKVRLLFLAGYYGDKRVYESIGFTEVRNREKYSKDDLANVGISRIELFTPRTNVVHTEICVIGSGAGGAVVAYNTAAAGKDVILLEEGAHTRSADMTHNESEMTARLFKEGGLQSTIDLDMNVLQGRTLGGSTVINNAICFRLNDQHLSTKNGQDVLEAWRKLGARIEKKHLDDSYDRVEKMIRVRRIPQSIAGENANVLLSGWENLRRAGRVDAESKHDLFRTNLQDCIGCGYCITGCPYGRKLSMAETYIPQAVREGARVITACHAVKIEMQGDRATGVHCELGDGRKLFVRAEKIVVACGAIGSSVLLMKSGIRKNVGKRFSCNAATPMVARFPNEINGFDGVQMPAYIDAGDFMLESWFVPPLSFAVTMPGWFNTHFERMKDYKHFASAGVLIGTEPNGRVKSSSFFRNLFGPLAYGMSKNDLERLKKGMVRMAQVYFAAGAEAVYPTSYIDLEMRQHAFRANRDIENFINEKIRKPDDLTLSTAHPQGGNPMSDDRRIGVIGSDFRVHGSDNLFVADASIFPTSIGINPQLTIMAMADYASQHCII